MQYALRLSLYRLRRAHDLEDYGTIRFDMGYACAIATLLFLLMIGTNKLVNILLRRVGD